MHLTGTDYQSGDFLLVFIELPTGTIASLQEINWDIQKESNHLKKICKVELRPDEASTHGDKSLPGIHEI